jgi:lipid-A-disaccharide synthase
MMLGRYMVAAYKVSPISAFIGRRLVKTPFFTIPNILLGEELYPEFMQERATKENILQATEKWLHGDEMTKSRISEKMAMARSMLGKTGVYESWAQRIMGAD